MNSDNLKLISNNVRGVQKSVKKSISPNGFIFLQETHSSVDDEKGWCDELNGNLYFSHEKTNSGGLAIRYVGSKSFVLANQTYDKNGCLLLIEPIVDDVKFVLINIYNCNTESQQLLTLTKLHKILQNVDDIGNKNIIIGGDVNFYFNSKLDAKGGKPILKKKSIRKIIESFELRDIWKIQNPTAKRFSFRQNHISGYIQRRLDYFLVSNKLQESISNTDILAFFLTDCFPISFTLRRSQIIAKGKSSWIFNSSLPLNKEFVDKMKECIATCLNLLEKYNILDNQARWEYLKYKVRKFPIKFSKAQAKKLRLERVLQEKI